MFRLRGLKEALRWLCLGVLAVTLLVACQPATQTPIQDPTAVLPEEEPEAKEPAEEETAPPAPENIFVFADGTSWPDMDPRSSFSNEIRVLSSVYEPLLYYSRPGSEERFVPCLATSWESNEDGTEWTFHLREGVKFHDGAEFNAEAVKSSIEATHENGKGAYYILDPIDKIEVVDDHTVKFYTSTPTAVDLILSSGYGAWMMSPNIIDKPNEWFNEGNQAGTGPYTIQSYELGERVVLKKFDDYWGGWQENSFDTVIMQVITDSVTALQMLEAGEVDGAWELPRESIPALEANPDVEVHRDTSFINWHWEMNTQRPPTDDKLVRQALSWSVPYGGIVEGVNKGFMTYAHGTLPPGLLGYDESLPQYSFNPDKAIELFAEAGWEDHDGDGWLDKDGEPMTLDFISLGYSDKDQSAILWSTELDKIGVKMNVNIIIWDAAWDVVKRGPFGEGVHDVFGEWWWPSIISPIDFFKPIYGCEDETVFNFTYYCNPELDAMFNEAYKQEAIDPEKAHELYVQVQEILLDEAVSVWVGNEITVHALRSDVAGYADNPAYTHVFFFHDLTRER